MDQLYNGIILPDLWPPDDIEKAGRDPLPVPYLHKGPDVIPIDCGRQLFVDDFLVESTNLTRTWHSAHLHDASPILVPETELEMDGGHCPVAVPFNDGLWYDSADGLFKLWYNAGWMGATSLATSRDGLHWERPDLDIVPATNAVIEPRPGYRRDGCVVWLDSDEEEPQQRFKMFLYVRWPGGEGGEIRTSADGVHWSDPASTSTCGDNSSFFYNPFRQRYVFSIRQGWGFRARVYREHEEFAAAARWRDDEPVPWARVDELDLADPLVGDDPQLYDVNAVAYESIMLGAFAIFYGPQNEACAETGHPKIIDLQLAYSRDGFHWHRPNRDAVIPCSREHGSWNYGYIHATGGVCAVVGDELWLYFGAFSGESPTLRPGEVGNFEQDRKMYAGGSTGVAVLRRDGFVSCDAGAEGGELLTRPLCFEGRYLFVNVDNPLGELLVEIADESGRVIEPFSAAACHAIAVDDTRRRVTWDGADNLSRLSGGRVRLRFLLRRGSLYSFWVSQSNSGCSGGYVAGGGPEFVGSRDI
jgi:hypothetical protein